MDDREILNTRWQSSDRKPRAKAKVNGRTSRTYLEFFSRGGMGGRALPVFLIPYQGGVKSFSLREKLSQNSEKKAATLSKTAHTASMKITPARAARYVALLLMVVLAVGVVAAPLVFSEAVVANFLSIVQALAKLAS